MAEDKRVEQFRLGVEAFTKALLDPYVVSLRASADTPHTKEINDSVWKTVVLQGFEVAVLDSPLRVSRDRVTIRSAKLVATFRTV